MKVTVLFPKKFASGLNVTKPVALFITIAMFDTAVAVKPAVPLSAAVKYEDTLKV